jgi:hypothetical protein
MVDQQHCPRVILQATEDKRRATGDLADKFRPPKGILPDSRQPKKIFPIKNNKRPPTNQWQTKQLLNAYCRFGPGNGGNRKNLQL